MRASFAIAVALAAMLGVGSAADALEFCVKEKDSADGGVRSGALVRVRESCNENELRVSPPDPSANAKQAVWRDADGKLVGPYTADGEVLHERNGRVFRLRIDRATGRLRRDDYPPVMAFYESPDCSGIPLFRPDGVPTLTEAFPLAQSGSSAYYLDESGSPRAIRSFWDDVFFSCTVHSLTLDVAPPRVLDLSAFREPFRLAIE